VSPITRRLAILATAAALALTTAAVPASAGTQPSPTRWAERVCTSVRGWFDAIEETLTSIRSSDSLSENVEHATDGIVDATHDLVHELDDLGLPRVEHGKRARAALRELGDKLEGYLRDAEDVLTGNPTSVRTLLGLSTILANALDEVATTVKTLKRVDPQGKLRTALEKTPACTMLRDAV
jgi:hypothetical protein